MTQTAVKVQKEMKVETRTSGSNVFKGILLHEKARLQLNRGKVVVNE